MKTIVLAFRVIDSATPEQVVAAVHCAIFGEDGVSDRADVLVGQIARNAGEFLPEESV